MKSTKHSWMTRLWGKRDKAITGKRSRMRRVGRYSLIVILVVVVVGGIWIGGILNPEHRFNKAILNPLTIPSSNVVTDNETMVQSLSTPAPQAQTDELTLTTSTQTPTAVTSPTDKKSSSFNVVLIGTDTWGGESSRADTIMVAHVMPDQRKVNIVSVPRDTRVYVQNVGYTKINHAHIVGETKGGNQQGTLTLIQAVSDFMNIPIHYYIKTNFSGVRDFIDSIGGIDMLIDQDVTITPEITIKKGEQHLDGAHTLYLARERYSTPEGDFSRQREQFNIVRAVAKKLLSPEHIPDLAGLLLREKKDIIDTSFSDSDLMSLAWLFKGMDSADFAYEQIPGHNSSALDPLVRTKVYYWSANPEEVKSLTERLFTE
ncbi:MULTISPECIES: LCP family protein [Paenibacillus]|uniref:LCP family protein n=2 Tax=Paenibacillus TaxID=44249 RepID=UPI0020C96E97|nr:LCP family protein [Paenibacillus odorifer]